MFYVLLTTKKLWLVSGILIFLRSDSMRRFTKDNNIIRWGNLTAWLSHVLTLTVWISSPWQQTRLSAFCTVALIECVCYGQSHQISRSCRIKRVCKDSLKFLSTFSDPGHPRWRESVVSKWMCSHLCTQPKMLFSLDGSGVLSSRPNAWGPDSLHFTFAGLGCCCCCSPSSSLPGLSFPRPSLSLSLSSPKMSSTCFRTDELSLALHGWITTTRFISGVQQIVLTGHPSLWNWF